VMKRKISSCEHNGRFHLADGVNWLFYAGVSTIRWRVTHVSTAIGLLTWGFIIFVPLMTSIARS